MIEALVIAVATLLGAVSQRVVGVGIALFLAPVALIFFAPPAAVVTTLFMGTLVALIYLIQTRRHRVVIPKIITLLLLGALPGLLLGAYILTRIDKALLQILLGLIVITAIVIQEYVLPKPSRPLSASRGVTLTGFFSGLLNATAAIGGPPMIIWLRTHASTPDQIRQNLAAMFVIVNLCSLIAIHYMRPQTFDHDLGVVVALLVPVVFLGNLIGTKLAKKVDVKAYEKLIVATVILMGVTSIGFGVANKL